jgi:ribulose-5-phosphate 4-epimerase/fuculose-1-phosphate aldolase
MTAAARRTRRSGSGVGKIGDLMRDLAAAYRLLALHGVVDAYGHVSVRDPRDAGRYLISQSLAPALVEPDDIVVLDLDSEPVTKETRSLYSERFIHGEIYRSRPDVGAVVHHHAPTTVAFGISEAPLRAVYHMSAFLGDGLPNFDILTAAGAATDMLVRTPALGRALAETVGAAPAALMRGHGAVVAGATLAQVVSRSFYMELNARIQLDAIRLGTAVRYLDPDEARLAAKNQGNYDRAWNLWKREAPPPPGKRR